MEMEMSPEAYARKVERHLIDAIVTLREAQDKFGMDNGDDTMFCAIQALYKIRLLLHEEIDVASCLQV